MVWLVCTHQVFFRAGVACSLRRSNSSVAHALPLWSLATRYGPSEMLKGRGRRSAQRCGGAGFVAASTAACRWAFFSARVSCGAARAERVPVRGRCTRATTWVYTCTAACAQCSSPAAYLPIVDRAAVVRIDGLKELVDLVLGHLHTRGTPSGECCTLAPVTPHAADS